MFGLRMRVVRMRLGDESIERTEYLTPRGRPVPADSRGNDRWFQHVALIVSDMDKEVTSCPVCVQAGDPPFYRDPVTAFHRYITMAIVSTLSAFLAVLVTFLLQ